MNTELILSLEFEVTLITGMLTMPVSMILEGLFQDEGPLKTTIVITTIISISIIMKETQNHHIE